MNLADEFDGKMVNAAFVDSKGGALNVTIDFVEREEMQNGEMKPVMHFVGKEKALVIRPTTYAQLLEIFKDAEGNGDPETQNWKGQRITLYTEMTSFENKRGVRIRRYVPQQIAGQPPTTWVDPNPPAVTPTGPPNEAQTQDLNQQVMDDEIPF